MSKLSFAEMLVQCKESLEMDADSDQPELEALLMKSYNADAAVAAWLDRGNETMEDEPARKPSEPSANSQASASSSGGGSKRPRVEKPEPQQMERDGINPLDALELDPFTRSKVHADEGLGNTLILMAAVMEAQFKNLSLQLPGQVAAAVPQAVRDHEEAEAQRAATESAERNNRPLRLKIEACTSVSQIAALPGWSYNGTDLVCQDCYRYASFAPGKIRRGRAKDAGVIKGVENPQRPFRIVKHAAKSHVDLGLHDWCVCHAAEVARIEEKGRSAGLICGKMVLQGIKAHDSDASFEERITTLESIGVGVGTKNHSRFFVPKLRESMHTVTVNAIQKVFTTPMAATKRPPPFCALADKATLQRQTGQMHGAIVPIEGELRALMLSVLPAPDSTGAGLADLLGEVFTGGKPLSLPRSLLRASQAGFAFDGQYQSENEGHACGLDVRGHYCRELGLKESYVDSRWDGAHRIELGMNTVRKEITFYGDLAGTVASQQSKYLYGKGYDRVLKAVEQLKKTAGGDHSLRLFAIGTVCDSRFCWSERRVYKNFASNLVTFILDMLGPRKNETGIDQELNKVRSIFFVVTLFGVIDLLRHVKDLSLHMQTVNRLPWEIEARSAAFSKLMDELATKELLE